jgi:hypothetical protein
MAPANLELVRTKDAKPGYYFAPGNQLMVVHTPAGDRFIPMVGEAPFVEVPDLESSMLMGLKGIEFEVSLGDPVKYDQDPKWGAGYLVLSVGGALSLAAFVRPFPQAEWERMLFDIQTCRPNAIDGSPYEHMWFQDWEIVAVRDGVRSTLAVSQPSGVTSRSFFVP